MPKLPVLQTDEISGDELADFLRRATDLVRSLPASVFRTEAFMEALMLSDALVEVLDVVESDLVVLHRRALDAETS